MLDHLREMWAAKPKEPRKKPRKKIDIEALYAAAEEAERTAPAWHPFATLTADDFTRPDNEPGPGTVLNPFA